MPKTPLENMLIYDESCFFCSNYIRLLKVKETIGNITLINARDREKVWALGFKPNDLNEGIILILNEQSYMGADAVHHLALISTQNGLFNRINGLIFKSQWLSRLLYPVLKLGRRLYLFLTGRTLIE